MVGFPSRRLAAGLFVCGVVLGACGKKEESGKSGDDNGAAAVKNQDLQLVPVDSELVLGLNLAQARDSKLFQELAMPRIAKNARVQAMIEKVKTKCGFDPMTAVSSITLGMKAGGGNGEGVVVVHGLEKAKALPCVDLLKDEAAEQKAEITKDGDVVLIKGDRPEASAAVSFVDDKTAIVAFGPKGNKAGVLEVAQGKSTLSSSKEFVDMYRRVKTGDTVWLLVNTGAEVVADALSKLNIKSKALFGSVNVTDGVALDLRLRVDSDEQAADLAKGLESQAAGFAQFAEKVEIDSEKSDVRMKISLTQEKLQMLMRFAGPMLRGRL